MAEKPEDLNLPNAVVFRIIKEAIPPGMIVSKDVRLAISKAASVFVLYCTATANAVAQAANRKTLSGQDVLTAMEEMEFEEFLPNLRAFLQEYKETTANKKQRKTGSPNQKPQSASKSAPVSPKQKQSPRPSPKKSSPKKSPMKKSPVKKSPVKDVQMSLDDSEDEFLRPAPVKSKVSRQSSSGASKVTSMEVDDSGDDSDVVVILD